MAPRTNEYKLRGSCVTSSADSRKKRSSVNAKYDRMFGNTLNLQYDKRIAPSSSDSEQARSLKAQEKWQQAKKDDEMMYKKMGVKVGKGNTGRGARNLNNGNGVAANLEKYRMGNVLPPRGNTPPAKLDDDLRRIIFPPPPPSPPPRSPTPPYQPLVPIQEPQSAIRRLSHSQPHQDSGHSYFPPHQVQHHQAQQQIPHPAQMRYTAVHPYPQHPAHDQAPHTPPAPYPPAVAPPHMHLPQINGWIWANGAWMFLPPPVQYSGSTYSPYPQLPPPPPSLFAHSSSPYYHSSPYPENSPNENTLRHPTHLGRHESEDRPTHDQIMKPKGILRNSGSSDASNGYPSSRTVTFRDTPDFASPPVVKLGEYRSQEEEYTSPPKWTLRKTASKNPSRREDRSLSSETGSQDGAEQSNQSRYESNSRVSTVPAILASAHQQLLHGHGVDPGASGKRSGRALVQNLEVLAEVQEALFTPRSRHEEYLANGNEAYEFGSESQQRRLERSETLTNKERGENAGHDTRRGGRHDGVSPEGCSHVNILTGSSMSPGEQDLTVWKPCDPMRTQAQTTGRNTIRRFEGTMHHSQPPESYTTDSSPLRQQSNKRRLPPPSQNWRESQRPQMAFSEPGSQSQSQLSASQLSTQRASQDTHSPMRASQQSSTLGQNRYSNTRLTIIEESSQQDHSLADKDQDYQDQLADRAPFTIDHGRRLGTQAQANQVQDDELDQEEEQDYENHRLPPSSPVKHSQGTSSNKKTSKRRLTDLEVRYDEDPTDTSYRPPTSPDADVDVDVDELDFDVDLDLDLDLEDEEAGSGNEDDHRPEQKRIKVTEGAWAKYDIPQDKLPKPKTSRQAPQHAKQAHTPAQWRPSRRPAVKEENCSQSQVSQIEQPESQSDNGYGDENGDEGEGGDDTIEGSWSYGHSQQSGETGNKNGRLSTIEEGDEEDEVPVQAELGLMGGRGGKQWVEDGFFEDGGELGFQIWRDRY